MLDLEDEYVSPESCILDMARKMREAKLIYECYVEEALDEKKRFNEAIVNKRSFDIGVDFQTKSPKRNFIEIRPLLAWSISGGR